jgi:hypothetical protein
MAHPRGTGGARVAGVRLIPQCDIERSDNGLSQPGEAAQCVTHSILLALYLAGNGADDVRRDLVVICPRAIKNAQTQVFRMARPSSRALVLRW